MSSLGILGGGQLAMMMTEAALRLGVDSVTVLDPNEKCPASCVGASVVVGDFKDVETVKNFCNKGEFNAVTIDIESVSVDGLQESDVVVYPTVNCLRIVQDKLAQRQYFAELADGYVKQPKFWTINEYPFGGRAGQNFVVKSRRGGYDGKGVWFMNNLEEFNNLMWDTGGIEDDFYIEEHIDIVGEYAVLTYNAIGMENPDVFPVTKTVQKDGICTEVSCPVSMSDEVRDVIKTMAIMVMQSFKTLGVMAFEVFMDKSGMVYLNEVSPRVHNSGHLTIEGCDVSPFEQHVRCVLGMKPVVPRMIIGDGQIVHMENVLAMGRISIFFEHQSALEQTRVCDGVLHWYRKEKGVDETYKKGRKIGHITSVIGKTKWRDIHIVMGSISDLPVMEPAIELLKEYNIRCRVDVVSAHRSPEWMM